MVDPATVAFAAATSFRVMLPLPVTLAGVRVAVTPEGTPETESETAEVNPPTARTFKRTLVVPLWAKAKLLMPASSRVKLGTSSVSGVLFVTPPPWAFKVKE